MTGDADRMDTETSTHHGTPEVNDAVWELLAMARQLINQGKPSQALQAV